MAQATATSRSVPESVQTSPASTRIAHVIIAGKKRGPGIEAAMQIGGQDTAARIVLYPIGGQPVSQSMVNHSLQWIRAVGHGGRVCTPAIGSIEAQPFIQCGFEQAIELALLTRPLPRSGAPGAGLLVDSQINSQTAIELMQLPRVSHRGRSRSEWLEQMLDVDKSAFPCGEAFDRLGIDEALHATPRVRVTLALQTGTTGPDNCATEVRKLVGYAIAGRAGARAYLQRLAVHPHASGRGIGSALCQDAMCWAAKRADTITVNTRIENARAKQLYQRLGFSLMPTGLVVLEKHLPANTQ